MELLPGLVVGTSRVAGLNVCVVAASVCDARTCRLRRRTTAMHGPVELITWPLLDHAAETVVLLLEWTAPQHSRSTATTATTAGLFIGFCAINHTQTDHSQGTANHRSAFHSTWWELSWVTLCLRFIFAALVCFKFIFLTNFIFWRVFVILPVES